MSGVYLAFEFRAAWSLQVPKEGKHDVVGKSSSCGLPRIIAFSPTFRVMSDT